MRKTYVILGVISILCIVALAFDLLGLFYGFGIIGNLAVMPIPAELLAVGMVCYVIGRFTTHLLFPLLVAGVCVAMELLFINTSNLQPLGLVLFCTFLLLTLVAAVIGFKLGSGR